MTEKVIKILYAEDDFVNQRVLEMKLKQAGIECDTAGTGSTALKLCEQNSYDAVVLDYYLPDMNGQELAQKIRERMPDIPLFAITSDEDLKKSLYLAGFCSVLIKPLRGNEIVRILHRELKF